ncbi:hypothetical protein E3P99_01777 [Wallemia hederae]|uniref:Peptidase C50 domain-containing protein n=1 Tax=Wallemia hederae TaxID=1540922 RepID=A0A4T0FNU8_9BASI|nr:hypothetical protein E3P99_01777 [Wallemia hederae]
MPFTRRPHSHLSLELKSECDAAPIPSHTFYTNILLNKHSNDPIYPLPYTLRIKNGSALISCPSERQLVSGVWGPPAEFGDASKHFWMPFIPSIALSSSNANLDDVSLSDMSSYFVNVTLKPSKASKAYSSTTVSSLRIPVSRGSAFVTGVYTSTAPALRSDIAFEDCLPVSSKSGDGSRHLVSCNDGGKWFVYSWPPLEWMKVDMHTLAATNADDSFSGVVQIAKLPDDTQYGLALYDRFCGSYCEGIELVTSFDNPSSGQYTFKHRLNNEDKPALFHLLPHHLDSLIMREGVKMEHMSLYTPSNGHTSLASSETGEFSFVDSLPSLQLTPEVAIDYPVEDIRWLEQSVRDELSLDWRQDVANEPSLYFAGKLVGRLANVAVIAHSILKSDLLCRIAFTALETCVERLLSDDRPHPLIHDTTVGGIISSAAHTTNDPLSDFGASFYNDIHFHASYLLYAGAVLLSYHGMSDDMMDKLVALLRSVNSTSTTSDFIAYRAFDWYVGHSWAKGMFGSVDGKDEESTSEAAHFYYAASLFSEAIEDSEQSITARLQLAIMRSSTNHYRLLEDTNTTMPARWRANRVGMCFENKRDHSTWFSQNIECIHGIHMLPLSPITPYIRSPRFISQEFESHLRNVFPTHSGWDAIIIADWSFSSNTAAPRYAMEWIKAAPPSSFDPGLSRSWAWVLAASNNKMTHNLVRLKPSSPIMASTSTRKTTTRMPSRSKLATGAASSSPTSSAELVDKLMEISTITDALHKQLQATLQPKSTQRSSPTALADRATLALRCCNACLKTFSSISRSRDSKDSKNSTIREHLPHLVACARVSLSTLRQLDNSLPTKAIDICRATLKCVEECNLLGFTRSALNELIALHPYLWRQLCPDAAAPIQVPPTKPQGLLLFALPKEPLAADLASVQLLYFQLVTRILLSIPNTDLPALASVLTTRGSLVSHLPALRQSLKMDQYTNGTTTLYKLLCRATTDNTDQSSSSALVHFKIRSKALMLINHNHSLDLNVWWTQGWKFGLSLLRAAPDALTPYTNEVKPFWSAMVDFAQKRNQSRFMQGKGWIEFCEGWMGIAKKLDDLSSLGLLAQLLSNESQAEVEGTEKLANGMSSLSLSGDSEELFAKYNVVLLTAAANMASKAHAHDFQERECSKVTHVLDSLKHLSLNDAQFHKAEKNVDGIRRTLYNKLTVVGEMKPSVAQAVKLHDDIALWIEHHLQQKKSLSPPILYGALDTLLQLAQMSMKDTEASIAYLDRALQLIEPLKSPQANRLLASAYWNWSCVLFHDGKAGTEAQCIPAVEHCLQVAEHGIDMCKETMARQSNENAVKGDKEMLNIMIDQRPKRYELLAICYSKIHDNRSAYEAFCKSIVCSLQTSSPPIDISLEDGDDVQNFQNLIKKAMQIGLSKIMVKPNELSLYHRAEKQGIDKNVRCRLVEMQITQIEERAWSDQDACSAVLCMLIELIGPGGYNVVDHPLRRAVALLRLMEQVVLGPAIALEAWQIPAPEAIFEEVRSIIQSNELGSDAPLKAYTLSYMLSAHMYLAIYYYRSSDTALEGSSSALREARHTKEILKTLLGTGSQRKSAILRDNNLPSPVAPKKPSQPSAAPARARAGSAQQPTTTATRATRSRTAASTRGQTTQTNGTRAARPAAVTKRVVKPTATKNTAVNKSTNNKGAEEPIGNLIYNVDRVHSVLTLLTEMLGILGHTFLKIDFLKLLRRMCQTQQRNSKNSVEEYLLTSTSLAAEYVKIGKIYRAGATFTQVASMKETPPDATSESWIALQINFNLRYAEYLARTGNVQKSLLAYNDAHNLKELYDTTVDKDHLKNPVSRTLNFERTAIAAHVFASIAFIQGDMLCALKCLAQCLRLLMNAARQLAKLTPIIETKSAEKNSDPFAMDVDDGTTSKSRPHANIFENRRCAGLHWRISQSLYDCMYLLVTLYVARGSFREANFFLDEALQITDSLASPNYEAKINAAKADLKMALYQLEDSKTEIDKAALSLGGQEDNESSVLLKKAKGDLQFRQDAATDASAGYLSACLILERLDKAYTEIEAQSESPKKPVKGNADLAQLQAHDPLLPDIFGHLLRQRIWILSEDENNAESQKLLDRLTNFPATATNQAEESMLLAKMRLREAYNSFQSDLFMSSLSDARECLFHSEEPSDTITVISIPCGSVSAAPPSSLTSRQPSLDTLTDAEKFFMNALEMNVNGASAKDFRQACLSIALIKSFQTSLGKVSKSNAALAATYLDLGSAITLRRELMEVIDYKINGHDFRMDANWPAIDQISSMNMLTPLNRRSKKLMVPAPSPLGSPMYEKDSLFSEEAHVNKYWEDIKQRHIQDLSTPQEAVRDTINKLPAHYTVISISITDDKKTMFVVKYRKDLDPLVVALPLDNRQNKREGGGEEEAFTYMNAAGEFEQIIKGSDDTIKLASAGKVTTDDDKIEWWNVRKALDSRMRQLVKNIEFCWLGAFKSLFMKPTATSEAALDGLRTCLEKVFKKHIHISGRRKSVAKVKLDNALLECFSALSPLCKDEELEDLIYFVLDVYLFHGIQLAFSEIDIDGAVLDTRSALEEYHNKYADRKTEGPPEHTFLILDKLTQFMPWESIPTLRNQSVSRIPSIGFLRDRLDYITFLNQDKFYVNPKKTFCLINPSGDLKKTEKNFSGWLDEMKEFGWKGIVGREPLEQEIAHALESNDLFLYFGHGGGQRYIRSQKIRNLSKCATTMLWGCSSGSLKSSGDFDSQGNPNNYLLAGCPCLVANLWDVTDRE